MCPVCALEFLYLSLMFMKSHWHKKVTGEEILRTIPLHLLY